MESKWKHQQDYLRRPKIILIIIYMVYFYTEESIKEQLFTDGYITKQNEKSFYYNYYFLNLFFFEVYGQSMHEILVLRNVSSGIKIV